MIVCDLQGRFKLNHHAFNKSRFVLTDPAISSRKREYGPTDLGAKGIESFFASHVCNKFCRRYGEGRWTRPRNPIQKWFVCSGSTSMMQSSSTYLLMVGNKARFNATLEPFYEGSEDEDENES